ncbi:archaetidylserine decarboxylase [Salisediminibacterium beveridgei]|uniref:phosphatidylserine decarboxylase n=1 Tax=Salisediminibacterium beveridgei TaxID=632773 RepID=A0A1D7QU86_9BACI|nr:archaetidylserine decarboxylase [Salisediminibacterium beveridgei]AOM82549.1 Phosphatidylserine decarboxylase [Salisediminibacterium beveridgei]
MKKTVYRTIMTLLTSRNVSNALRAYTLSKYSRPLIKPFAKWIKFNQEESQKKLADFESLSAIFTRQLKEGARPVASGRNIIVSPADGVLTASGKMMGDDAVFQVKGSSYSLKELIGKEELLRAFTHGSFAVIYLAPHNYHRVHAPVSGDRLRSYALGCRSEPVNRWGLTYGRNPLSGNYRLITEVATDFGQSAVIKVGAVNVNSIQLTAFDRLIEKGDEMGFFSFGSTVILLFESQYIDWIEQGEDLNIPVLTGERIGQVMGE